MQWVRIRNNKEPTYLIKTSNGEWQENVNEPQSESNSEVDAEANLEQGVQAPVEPVSATLEESLEKYSIELEPYQIEMLKD